MKNWLTARSNFTDLTVVGLVVVAVVIAVNPDSANPAVPEWAVWISVAYAVVGGVWIVVSGMSPSWQRVVAWTFIAASMLSASVGGAGNWPLLLAMMAGAVSQAWRAARGIETYRDR